MARKLRKVGSDYDIIQASGKFIEDIMTLILVGKIKKNKAYIKVEMYICMSLFYIWGNLND